MKRTKRKTKKTVDFQLPSLQLKVDWRIGVAILLFTLLIIVRFWLLPDQRPTRNSVRSSGRMASQEDVREVCNRVLQETFSIDSNYIQLQDTMIQVVLPRNFPFFDFYTILRNKLNTINAQVADCAKSDDGQINMIIHKRNQIAENLQFTYSRRVEVKNATIALILDDFGYSFNNTIRKFLTLPHPITVSIIPGTPHAKQIAEAAHLNGRQILVHMPMEPLNIEYDDDGYTLVTSQDGGTVSLRIHKAFADIPFAVGMNNHQGSKVTADTRMMGFVMQTLRPLNKFFIDSFTNVHSIAYETARQNNILTAKNSFFIDAEDKTDFIISQMRRAASQARQRGSLVAIGHTRPKTLAVLESMMPELAASGITFVYVSDLLE